jgi:hypothetical protein
MTNLECTIAILASHREARRWTDEAVALDVLAQLGLDPAGDAAHASPIINPQQITEDEVVAAEAAAKEAADKARAAREALGAQAAKTVTDDPATAEVVADDGAATEKTTGRRSRS